MKLKATKKEMRNGFNQIIGTGYCSMTYLLRHQPEYAYSSRTEGWACDYYVVDGVLISTGYDPLKSKNVSIDYATIEKYENQARNIALDYSIKWDEQTQKINDLLHELVALAKGDTCQTDDEEGDSYAKL